MQSQVPYSIILTDRLFHNLTICLKTPDYKINFLKYQSQNRHLPLRPDNVHSKTDAY